MLTNVKHVLSFALLLKRWLVSGSAEMPKIGARESAVGGGHATRGEQLVLVARWCAVARLLTLLMQWPGGEQNTGGGRATA